jgi:hypothetical protein
MISTMFDVDTTNPRSIAIPILDSTKKNPYRLNSLKRHVPGAFDGLGVRLVAADRYDRTNIDRPRTDPVAMESIDRIDQRRTPKTWRA